MRKRKVQREMNRVCEKEEKIDLYDCCGIKDPTPYEAVSNLVKQERKAAKKAAKRRRALARARAIAVVETREAVAAS